MSAVWRPMLAGARLRILGHVGRMDRAAQDFAIATVIVPQAGIGAATLSPNIVEDVLDLIVVPNFTARTRDQIDLEERSSPSRHRR